MLWRQYKLKALNSSPSICLSWRHIQTTVKLMLLCVSRAIKIIFRGAYIGKLAETFFKCTYLGKSTGTLWIFILMSIPVMKYVYTVVYKDYSS